MSVQGHLELIGATMGVLLALSGIGFSVFPRNARIPMQWGMDGKPTWYAPKVVGLLFTPVLALGVMSLMSLTAQGMRMAPIPNHILVTIAASFLCLHVLHLCMAWRHFRSARR